MTGSDTQTFYKHENNWDWLATICCIAMIAGMFFSRVLLSFSMLLLFLTALRPGVIAENWSRWRQSKFALFSLAFFLVYLFSGLWSGNKDFWLASATNKLPFAALPFAFMVAPLHKEKFQKIVIFSILFMQLSIMGNSLYQLMINKDFYLNGYSVSQPLPTTKYGDHIRFSLSLVMSVLMSFYLLFEPQTKSISKWLKVFLWVSIVISLVYIHILAAKTGLICLYLMAIIYGVAKLIKKSKLMAVVLALAIVALPFIAYRIIPTFRTKTNYVIFEVTKSRKEKRYDYTLSDAGRMITYDIGAKAILAYPWLGVGAGDVMDEMRGGYRKYYPEVSSDQQYGPINQFMFTALSVGIPLSLFLVAFVISSFFADVRLKLYLIITSLLMLVSMMVEAMLELQFGVFSYLFFILFWMSSLRKEKNEQKEIIL